MLSKNQFHGRNNKIVKMIQIVLKIKALHLKVNKRNLSAEIFT